MRTITPTQMRILQDAMPALVVQALGLSGEALHTAIRPVWAQAIAKILHNAGDCTCQQGGICFLDLPLEEQNRLFEPEDDLSLDAFVRLYEKACREALRNTPTF